MSAPVPLNTFHPFSRLPKEIRIQIWRAHLTSMEPRTLTIRSDYPNNFTRPLQYFRSSNPVPSVLHICRESRLEALSFYVAAFTNGSSPRFTWTNFHFDTINLTEWDLCKLSQLDKTRMRQMIVESISADYFHGECRGEFKDMADLARLKIISTESLYAWEYLIGSMRKNFIRDFANIPGYVCPEIRIVQKGTQWEMNVHNYEAIMRVWNEQVRPTRGGI
ncbi:hypothetical protein BKA65DRAFT_125313 [Rhexocercosporidium sp. MPI-PUGE-AT-0058]|nr:hypothetical protein BKA65DRAFT_125313 [Rhexocercosporidium sp. MPI-PUGE-AT-0058]